MFLVLVHIDRRVILGIMRRTYWKKGESMLVRVKCDHYDIKCDRYQYVMIEKIEYIIH